ncbi:tetratricopeptide repeat protein [Actinomadura sp. KC345]|uniref:aspartyl protease family protein n=1 Tax=Actinomadura sp. KC345 TaxID=2530371 RepID=UPI00104D7A1A|nr:aspartyl protease family protein [Actinomadura sp. KC345]TDC58767.1 tetratricopeptide repeat protein [Actinomadura sp. KC345]
MAGNVRWDRRSLLRGGALVAGAAAASPLLGRAAAAQDGGDADALFKAGKFEQAGRAYEEILKHDPGNVHAASRRGYVGLLSNRFSEAEKYLKTALKLAPGDKDTNRLMADCYLRQDRLSLSASHWRAAGMDVFATWFGAVRGEPYQVHGDIARLPFQQLDPTPLVEGSVNGGPPKPYVPYTGAPWLGLSKETAEEAGLTPVAKQQIDYLDGKSWQYFGVLDSFALDGIELRNVPVVWTETDQPSPGGADGGLIGTWVFYHLLTTFDYAGRSLTLRRRTPETARRARADAARAGAAPLPLWLAREHMTHSVGSVAGSGDRVVGLSVGGTGESAVAMSEETAKRWGVRIDHDRPLETFAHSRPVVTYPCYPEEVRLGDASAEDVYSVANPGQAPARNGFDVLTTFFHSFYKPYNITLDFTGMKVYVARGKAA